MRPHATEDCEACEASTSCESTVLMLDVKEVKGVSFHLEHALAWTVFVSASNLPMAPPIQRKSHEEMILQESLRRCAVKTSAPSTVIDTSLQERPVTTYITTHEAARLER